jgi:DNA-binding NarL/FixJ family response regulator
MGTELSKKIRVLVVDDHPVVRDGVALLATTCPSIEIVGYAPTGRAAMEFLSTSEAPHVILLDLRLPDMLAPELIGGIRTWAPGARIIVFTAFPEHPAVRKALEAGACGVLTKDAARLDLVSVILGTVRPDQSPHGDSFARENHSVVGRREYDVLRRVAIGETNQEIAEAMHLSPNTVKSYLRNLMGKLDARNRVQAISRAREAGLL